MDIFLGKVTQQAMNYAIRSGITITAGYAIRQSSRLLKTVEGNEKEELQDLQERLDSKIRIIAPAIDMIELISARGNTSLESAVSLTKSLRWEIQALGQRLAAAATAEELVRRRSSKANDKAQHELELKRIVQAIRKLLNKIEDAVPLINLAITASGASLSSGLPSTVSPSRLLQASTFLTAGDSQYSISNTSSVQIGPTFTLSMYMLFLGHLRPQNEEDVRESTWKEVIHKAHVKLVRVPIEELYNLPGEKRQSRSESRTNENEHKPPASHAEEYGCSQSHFEGGARADEYAYQLVVVEDLDDDRLHTFEENEEEPGLYGGIRLAGIREAVPIHEISKIFYADTGKILNIGSEGEINSPVLLLKRDINAVPPRRMMERYGDDGGNNYDASISNGVAQSVESDVEHNDQSMISHPDHGYRSSSPILSPTQLNPIPLPDPWRIPPDLDPEWIAFEVYTEAEDSDTESETDLSSDKPARPSRTPSLDPQLNSSISNLQLNPPPSTPSSPLLTTSPQSQFSYRHPQPSLPPIRTSLSLLETLLRLLSLQQFQQTPHLSIPDELLNFFLSESASTGASDNDTQERKRLRTEARRRVGFDPYDESPVKRRGEEYQYRSNGENGEAHQAWQEGRSYDSYEEENPSQAPPNDRYGHPILRYGSPRFDEGYDTRNWTPPNRPSPSPRNRHAPSPPTSPLQLKHQPQSQSLRSSTTPERSTSSSNAGGRYETPLRPWRPGRRDQLMDPVKRGSPLARPTTGITDEGLGTSPVSGEEEK